jgi:hypothetical protein
MNYFSFFVLYIIDTWRSRWVESTFHEDDGKKGKWGWEAPKKTYDPERGKGIKTTQDSMYYHMTADIGKTISTENQTLILSYTVCNTQSPIKCVGQYIKLLPEKINQLTFNGDDHFYIMFGPDYCGTRNDRVHCMFRKDKYNLQMKERISTKRDRETHLYTLIINPDFTFEIHIDDVVEKKGDMITQWRFWEPKYVW